MTEQVERRLAAILAADVVGYSRLMERNETGTFERLKHRAGRYRAHSDRHRGRLVDLKGDGRNRRIPKRASPRSRPPSRSSR